MADEGSEVTISGGTIIEENTSDGVYAQIAANHISGDPLTQVMIASGFVRNNGRHGIHVIVGGEAGNVASPTVTTTNTHITGNGAHGVNLLGADITITSGSVLGNTGQDVLAGTFRGPSTATIQASNVMGAKLTIAAGGTGSVITVDGVDINAP